MKISKSLGVLMIGAGIGVLAAYAGLAARAQSAESQRSVAQRLQALEDEREIRQLYARYMHYLDHRDMVKYSETFTPDGIVIADQGRWEGRAAMQKMFEPKPGVGPDGQPRKPVEEMTHMVTDIVLHIDGDTRAAGVNISLSSGRRPASASARSFPESAATTIGSSRSMVTGCSRSAKFSKRTLRSNSNPVCRTASFQWSTASTSNYEAVR